MMELGIGIAIAGLSLSGGAVAITAIKVKWGQRPPPNYGTSPTNGHRLCQEHSGLVANMRSIKETTARQEEWLKSISADMRTLADAVSAVNKKKIS